MKHRNIVALLVIVVIIFQIITFSLPFSVNAQNSTIWYVATTGSDSTGDGTMANPFQSIQHAINAASHNDVVVVMKGRYTGSGNVNLNFMGKAITVQSQNPDDDALIRATIIDGDGRGVIVRFINDEGPKSVFAGFTLIAGDTSIPIRGVPGFFEFSKKARPSTRRLRIEGNGLPLTTQQISSADGPPDGERYWDGNNPFSQPAATTDYYGSGDANNDGNLTLADASMAQDMANSSVEPSPRADVDGNGVVDTNDVSLINSTLSGGELPGWWNNLSNRTQRNSWIDKILEIDQTDKHTYIPTVFVCYNFAVQTFIHGAYYRGDLFGISFNGGQTLFNVPMYSVGVMSSSYGHAINAILIGDDPLNFNDWRFIEPQTDYDVYPGMWDMPYGTDVSIEIDYELQSRGSNFVDKVTFSIGDGGGITLKAYSPDLILTRPTPVVRTPDNRPDLWNPRIVPIESGELLFERIREDMSRITDIHLTNLPFADPPASKPLVMDTQYSRLLDLFQEPDGTIHLLWEGEPGYIPGLFHGRLDPITSQIEDVTRVSSDSYDVRMGRIIVLPGGDIHAFWLQTHPYYMGIYWTRWTGTGWQSPQNLTPTMDNIWEWPTENNRDFLRYFFDVTRVGNDDIILIWTQPIGGSGDATIHQLRYDGGWGVSTTIDTTNAHGAELLTDSAGILHLIYWLGGLQTPNCDGRGTLIHRTSDNGTSWSIPATVDSSGGACCPKMVSGTGGDIYMVWERKVGSQVIPFWTKYENGVWYPAQILSVRSEADAWYPTADFLPDGKLAIVWSSRSPDRVTIETIVDPPFSPIPSSGIFLPIILKEIP